MNRRSFIQGTTTGAAGVLVLNSIGCGGKSIVGTVAIISGAIQELKPLFPAQSATFDKIVSLATDFSNDWTKGLFDNAKVAFENLDTLINQVITDLGVNATTKVKLILATLGIGLRVIASIVAEQGSQNVVAARRASTTVPQTVNRVNQLADPAVADKLLRSVKP